MLKDKWNVFEPCNLQGVGTGHNNDVTVRQSCTVLKTLETYLEYPLLFYHHQTQTDRHCDSLTILCHSSWI